MLCALIMAGGKGTRFWPLSTEEKPKQFLNLLGEETMIQMTVNRIKSIIPTERIFICTGKQYVTLVKEQLPDLPEENIIIEPYGKNTAPCIALSAFHIEKRVNNSTMLVLPSDHLIKNEKAFLEVIKSGELFVEDNEEAIITIGMRPDRAETGYGYINYSILVDKKNNQDILKVNRFVEKPTKGKAESYLKDGSYLWNGGMFIWKSSNILNLTNKYINNTYRILEEICLTEDESYSQILEEKYNLVDDISVDYGIMEKTKGIYVIPGDFGWDDVGNWSSIQRYDRKDTYGNVFKAEGKVYNSSNNIILANKKIILNGVENIIMVETEDYILVSSKDKEQDIKKAITC